MKLAKIALTLAVAVAFVALAMLFHVAADVVERLPAMIDNRIHVEAEETRKELLAAIGATLHVAQGEIQATRGALVARLASAEGKVIGEVRGARGDAVAGLLALQNLADNQLSQANLTLGTTSSELTNGVSQIAAIAPPLQGSIEAFRQQFLLPANNPAALYPRWAALSQEAILTSDSVRRLMEVVAREAPPTAAAFRESTQNVARFTRPRKWWRLWLW